MPPRACVVILRDVFAITSHVESRGRACFSGLLVPFHLGRGVVYDVSSVSKLRVTLKCMLPHISPSWAAELILIVLLPFLLDG